jgi:hypothetical protein
MKRSPWEYLQPEYIEKNLKTAIDHHLKMKSTHLSIPLPMNLVDKYKSIHRYRDYEVSSP